jgi:hypothetical protein
MNEETIENIIADFIQVCRLAKVEMKIDDIKIEKLTAGEKHVPTNLPAGNMAVYIFVNDTESCCYKVGKVGVNSNARYQSQHYIASSSKSNLAKSILDDYNLNHLPEIQQNVGSWIKQNTTRINLKLSAQKGVFVLNLLEAFIQNRLKPKYEGYKSQRI